MAYEEYALAHRLGCLRNRGVSRTHSATKAPHLQHGLRLTKPLQLFLHLFVLVRWQVHSSACVRARKDIHMSYKRTLCGEGSQATIALGLAGLT